LTAVSPLPLARAPGAALRSTLRVPGGRRTGPSRRQGWGKVAACRRTPSPLLTPAATAPRDSAGDTLFLHTSSRPGYTDAQRSSPAARGAWPVHESTAVLQGQLERALTGDAAARRRLLELTRDRLMRSAAQAGRGLVARSARRLSRSRAVGGRTRRRG